jgi:phosphatidate cytidylyltransferase
MSYELKKRILSALVIGPAFILSILYIPFIFITLLLIIGYFMLSEWYHFANSSKKEMLIGLITIALSIASIILLIQAGLNIIILLYFMIMWATDSFAMFGGKTIGGYKLAPKISPNKTWSGLLTGVSAAIITAVLFDWVVTLNKYHTCFYIYKPSIFALFISLLCQLSDLFVSIFKRKHNIKDSGNIIPGHGGMLDRFDSMILSSPILFLLLAYR